jgi:protocatechuate 3,4-dioxygenase beta subunit
VSGSTGTITGQQGELLSFEVTVRDGTGAPMSAATVTLVSQDGSLTAGAPAVSNADGVATLNVAIAPSAVAGQLPRALQVSSGSYTQDLTVTVEAVPASVSLTAASVVAGGESPLLATVTDYTGNPVSGQRVQFSWPSGTAPTGLRFSKSATTDVNGVATGVVTPSSAVQDGEYTIRASVSGLSVDSELTVSASGVGLATDGADFTPSVIASGSTGTWVGHVVNENGRPAAGVEVSLDCEACGLGFSPGVVTSGEGGVVSFTVTDTGGANPPGRYSIDVSLGGVQTRSRVTVTGVATALSVESDQVSVRRGENLMVSVTATDASGSGVGGVQVTQLGDSGATVRPARTSGAGVARVRVTAPEVVGVLTVTLQSGTASVAVTLEVLP